MKSVKQRLVDALRAEIEAMPDPKLRAASMQAYLLSELEKWDDGPLPFYLRQAARWRGIV